MCFVPSKSSLLLFCGSLAPAAHITRVYEYYIDAAFAGNFAGKRRAHAHEQFRDSTIWTGTCSTQQQSTKHKHSIWVSDLYSVGCWWDGIWYLLIHQSRGDWLTDWLVDHHSEMLCSHHRTLDQPKSPSTCLLLPRPRIVRVHAFGSFSLDMHALNLSSTSVLGIDLVLCHPLLLVLASKHGLNPMMSRCRCR